MTRVFLLLLLPLTIQAGRGARKDIPNDVMRKIKMAQNFAELVEEGIEVLDTGEDDEVAAFSNDEISSLKNLSISQGRDRCKLVSTCVETRKNDDNRVITFPDCHEVLRCSGSCCNDDFECKAIATKLVERETIEMKYRGPTTRDEGKTMDQFTKHARYMQSLEEHTSCKCTLKRTWK